MKVYCKRTYFETNSNFHKINGKGYGEKWVKWEKGKYYEARKPSKIERQFGIIYYISTEKCYDKTMKSYTWSPIKLSDFKKHFVDIDDLREEKINTILNG